MAGRMEEPGRNAAGEPQSLWSRVAGWWRSRAKARARPSSSHTDQFDAIFAAELRQLCERHEIRPLAIRQPGAQLRRIEEIEAGASALSAQEVSALAEAYSGDSEVMEVRPPVSDTLASHMQAATHFIWRDDLEFKDADPDRRRHQLSGLALSGGGIRSAAFACGVLEALARNRRLESFDYLSTVSGGGYTGTALTWALHQNPDLGANDFADFRVAETQANGGDPRQAVHGAPPAEGIRLLEYIRRRAKYLAPTDELSLLSGLLNTLRMSLASFAIYAAVAVAAILPLLWLYYRFADAQCVEQPFPWMPQPLRDGILYWASFFAHPCFAGLSLFCAFVIAMGFVAAFLIHVLAYAFWPSFEMTYANRLAVLRNTTHFSTFMLGFFVLFLLPLVHSYNYAALDNPLFYASGLGALGISGISSALSLIERLGERARALLLRLAAFFLFFAMLLGAFAIAHWIVRDIYEARYWFFRPAAAHSLGNIAYVGAIVGMLLGFAGALINRFANRRIGLNLLTLGSLLMVIAGALFGVILLEGAAVLLGLDLDPQIYVPWLRLLWVLVAVVVVCNGLNPNSISSHRFYRDRLMEAFMPSRTANGFRAADEARLCDMFTPQARAATRPISAREADVLAAEATAVQARRFRAPYHILNANVILVASNQPKYYQRGGDSFIMSPLYCGSTATGWIATESHSVRLLQGGSNFQLATAMAISGAAANPNTADGEDAVTRRWSISFLMTLFNIRLGSWQPNPARRRSAVRQETTPPPSFWAPGVNSLISGYFDETRHYVELSDGGHFDNTGLYELFRRRVRDIVLADASCDPDYSLDDLARAVALAHVDFGVTVTFQHVPLAASSEIWKQLGASPGQPSAYRGKGYPSISDGLRAKLLQDGFAAAVISYPKTDTQPAMRGSLIYLKPALVADAPVDLLSYALNHPDFPHQATSDQFFSERRFESYRRLGEVIGLRMCETVLA